MTKREFLIQYVLNRASTITDNFTGEGAAKEALKAWEIIEKESRRIL